MKMKRLISTVTAAGLAITMFTAPIQANSDTNKAAVAALLLLGVAALAHHEHNHPSGKHKSQPQDIADWDRGFSDGLHNFEYNSELGNRSSAYVEGFDSGDKERNNRTVQHRREQGDKSNAPALAMKACVGAASEKWGSRPHHIHVVKTKQAASNDFFVEVAAGNKHGNCEVSSQGKIYLFKDGRI